MKKQEISKAGLQELFEGLSPELSSGKPLTGKGGVFTPLLKQIIEASLEGEMDAHMDQTRSKDKNRRNGRTRKNIQSSLGGFEIFAPRDRSGSFDPQMVRKRQHRISSDIDAQILSLYSGGMSYSDIRDHLMEIYGVAISKGTLTSVTDRVLPQIRQWQNRPLEDVYPVIWLDAMHFKVRDQGKVSSKAIYSVPGVNKDGQKQVIGLYFGDNESGAFRKQVLYDLQERGIKDIFVACIDNLSGFADAIEDLFPRTDVQLCLVHQMRNSVKYATHTDIKPLAKALRRIYRANNEQMAQEYLREAEEQWGQKYKVVFRSWHNNRERLTAFLRYPPALRRVIYTTNPIESYHRMVRKATKTKGAFTSETAIIKQIYLATINTQARWNGTMFGWSNVRRDLCDYFEDRFLTNNTL